MKIILFLNNNEHFFMDPFISDYFQNNFFVFLRTNKNQR